MSTTRASSDGERRLWFVRHGETEGQSSIRYHGSNDVALSDEGRAQIRAVVPLLEGASFQRIVHSPLIRAAESARILCDGLGLSEQLLEAEPRLREISFGACEGLTREEIEARYPSFFADYEAGRLGSFPDGEPRAAFAARVLEAARELAAADGGDLLIVVHRGIIKYALLALLGLEDRDASSASAFAVDLGSLTVLREDADAAAGWQVELLGMRV
ncbi:MAG: histidine phosphatase family protein [Planctomycetota bacterium]